MVAFINGLILVLLAGYIFYEAFKRFKNPEPVDGGIVMVVAYVGILVNGGVVLIFRKNNNDLNIRSAYTNMFFDILASVGALLAGLLIIVTRLTFFDSLISILIEVLLLRSSWAVIRDAMNVLLKGIPEGLDIKKVEETILKFPKN